MKHKSNIKKNLLVKVEKEEEEENSQNSMHFLDS